MKVEKHSANHSPDSSVNDGSAQKNELVVADQCELNSTISSSQILVSTANGPQEVLDQQRNVASLHNLGNTCYINSAIQMLFHTPDFVQLISNLAIEVQLVQQAMLDCSSVSDCDYSDAESDYSSESLCWKLISCLNKLFTRMKHIEDMSQCGASRIFTAIRPYDLLDIIMLLNPMFADGLQHDAHELFRCLISHIDSASDHLTACRRDLLRTRLSSSRVHHQDRLLNSRTRVDGIIVSDNVGDQLSASELKSSIDGPFCCSTSDSCQLNGALNAQFKRCSYPAENKIQHITIGSSSFLGVQYSSSSIGRYSVHNATGNKLHSLLHPTRFKLSGRKLIRRSARRQTLAVKRSTIGRSLSLTDVSVFLEPLSLSCASSWSATSLLDTVCQGYPSPDCCSTPSGFDQRNTVGCSSQVFNSLAKCELNFDSASPPCCKKVEKSVVLIGDRNVFDAESSVVVTSSVDENRMLTGSNGCLDISSGQLDSSTFNSCSVWTENVVFSQLDALDRGKTCKVELERVDSARLAHISRQNHYCSSSGIDNKTNSPGAANAEQCHYNVDVSSWSGSASRLQLGHHVVNVSDVFGGKLAMITHCLSCGGVTVRDETYEDIALAINSNQKGRQNSPPYSWIFAALDEVERLEGDNRYNCSHCNKLADVNRSVRYITSPSVLMFHLIRFTAQSRYELYGIMAHCGRSVSSGHYIAYVRGVDNHNSNTVQPVETPAKPVHLAQDVSFTGHQLRPRTKHRFPGCLPRSESGMASDGEPTTSEVGSPPVPNEKIPADNSPVASPTSSQSPGCCSGTPSSSEQLLASQLPAETSIACGQRRVWYECDDDVINVLTETQFEAKLKNGQKMTPYMLFYRKCYANYCSNA